MHELNDQTELMRIRTFGLHDVNFTCTWQAHGFKVQNGGGHINKTFCNVFLLPLLDTTDDVFCWQGGSHETNIQIHLELFK